MVQTRMESMNFLDKNQGDIISLDAHKSDPGVYILPLCQTKTLLNVPHNLKVRNGPSKI